MKTTARYLSILPALTIAALCAAPLCSASLLPVSPRCDGRDSPLGIDSAPPRFSWKLEAATPSARGLVQTAYQVLVASSPALLGTDTGDLWDSGKVTSDAVNQIVYAGQALATSQKVHWKVRVWDGGDDTSPWSAPATFTMGVLAPEDWQAQWITPSTAATDAKSTQMRKDFTVSAGLVRAIIHVSGLGQCETTVNGSKAVPDHMTPGWTLYNKTVLYDTYDITSLLQTGANAVGLTLGNGMYNIPRITGRYAKWIGSSGPRKAIARIHLEYSNGTSQTVLTDGSWKWRNGPITFNTIYGGEDYDARQEQAGWDTAGFNASSWSSVNTTSGPGGVLRGTSHAAPPLSTFETFNVTPALVGTAASKVYDFGQNALQLPTLVVYGPAGATVKLTPSELGSTAGTGTISPIVSPSFMTYTLKGSTEASPETFTPRFFSFGYRYLKVEITGGATITSLTSKVVHTASEATGEFTCSKDLFNRTRTLIRWAQRSNLVSIISDCPHREKLGWLEQYYLHGPSLRYEFDLQALYGKTYTDMADSQRTNGLVPDIAPEYVVFSGDYLDSPEWGSAFVLSPAQQYQFYNDRSAVEENYPNIKRYVDYLTSRASGHIVNYGLGDWFDLGPDPLGKAQLTPVAVTATATYYSCAKSLAGMAAMLGNTADAATYTALAANIRAAFNTQFYNATTGSYSTGSQTANSMPLVLGIVEESEREKVVAALVADIRGRGNSLTAGDIGHIYLLRALADNGRSDVIYDIHSKTSTPGYGYILNKGATSLTEGWDGSVSQNHFMLGHIIEWFYHDLAGIQMDPAVPGFKKVIIKPSVAGDVTFANADYNSVRGPVASHWTLAGTELVMNLTIPPGSTSEVFIPTFGTPAASLIIREGGTVIWQDGAVAGSAPSVSFNRMQAGAPAQTYSVWNVGSGTYQFSAQVIQPPTSLSAVPGSGQNSLTWNAAPDATSYEVKRSTTAGTDYVTIASGLTATSFTDTGLTNGTKYYYIVIATTPAGTSGPSNEASATPDFIVNKVIYADDFSGSSGTNLNGQAPDTRPGSETWTASTTTPAWKANGSIAAESSGTVLRGAFLPFTPTTGNIYTLSLDINSTNNTGEWLAFGFTQAAGLTSDFYGTTTNAGPWLLDAGIVNPGGTGNTGTFLGGGTLGTVNPGAPGLDGSAASATTNAQHSYKIVLDTNPTLWTATWFRDDIEIRTAAYTTNPTINYIGIFKHDNAAGTVDNLSLTVGGAPYATWAGAAVFDEDDNNDGVENGLAWLLGAASPAEIATGRLPVVTQTGGNLEMSFTCLKVAGRGTALLKLQYSKDLGITDAWASHEVTVPDAAGMDGSVTFTVPTVNGDPDLVDLKASIPVSEAAPGTTLFGRLMSVKQP